MEIRLAHPNEVNAIMTIIDEARQHLAESGSDQWQNGYPDFETIFDDVLENRGYVGLIEGEVVAYAAVYLGNEEAYAKIYDGKWAHDNYMYVTFHRIAVSDKYRGQKVGQTFLQGLIEGQKGNDFRSDTHEKNKAMQAILEKLGFVYCGKVMLEDGERLAYQKIKQKHENSLYQEINEDDRWMVQNDDHTETETPFTP